MKFSFLALLISLVLQIPSTAQVASDDWIVKLTLQSFEKYSSATRSIVTDSYETKTLSKRNQIIQIKTTKVISEADFKEQFSQLDCVRFYPNAELQSRNKPNDDKYDEQWGMDIINMPDVWDITTGGMTFHGEEIVVAIMDDGFEIDHPDLKNNIWTNPAEVPNDGLDNDGNGYKDDYNGLNVDTEDGLFEPLSHGTRVAGIIGAEGDNDEGIAGTNWSIKIMPVGGINQVAEIIEAFDYIINMKELYVSSGGTKGANILVTNLSQGLDRVFPETHFDWCEAYEDAAKVGILSVGAAPNEFYNVDVEGDLPSLCTSNSLIMVTNTDRRDVIAPLSAVGPEHIDIAAPGELILSTYPDGRYETISGTSASAPHVAGVAALLYSICGKLADLTKSDPEEAVSVVKDAILDGAFTLSSLQRTVSGGRLDAYSAFLNISGYCLGTGERQLEIKSIATTGNFLLVDYDTDRFDDHSFTIYNSIGQTIKVVEFRPTLFGEPQIDLEVNDLASGYYVLNLSNASGTISLPFFWSTR